METIQCLRGEKGYCQLVVNTHLDLQIGHYFKNFKSLPFKFQGHCAFGIMKPWVFTCVVIVSGIGS